MPLLLPRKVQLKLIYEESEPQKQVQQKLSLDKMRNEIELKKLRASTN